MSTAEFESPFDLVFQQEGTALESGTLIMVGAVDAPGFTSRGPDSMRTRDPLLVPPTGGAIRVDWLGFEPLGNIISGSEAFGWGHSGGVGASARGFYGVLDGDKEVPNYGRIYGQQQIGSVGVPVVVPPIYIYSELHCYLTAGAAPMGDNLAVRIRGVKMRAPVLDLRDDRRPPTFSDYLTRFLS